VLNKSVFVICPIVLMRTPMALRERSPFKRIGQYWATFRDQSDLGSPLRLSEALLRLAADKSDTSYRRRIEGLFNGRLWGATIFLKTRQFALHSIIFGDEARKQIRETLRTRDQRV